MDLLDVNVLIHAHRSGSPNHQKFAEYLRALGEGTDPFAVPSVVFSGFLRIATHPRIFSPPTPLDEALLFVEEVSSLSNCVILQPGANHLSIFLDLCRVGGARGSLVSDAYLAAIAKESGAELVTDDRGFGRWPGLRWRHL